MSKTAKIRTKRALPVRLTASEWQDRVADLAKTHGKLVDLTSQIGKLHVRKRKLRERFDSLSAQVRTYEEHRDVPIEIVADFASATLTITRKDTGEEVAVRRLSPDECSRKLEDLALEP